MTYWQKVLISALGAGLSALSLVYVAHPDAPIMAYVAGVSGSLGAYFVGLMQTNGAPTP